MDNLGVISIAVAVVSCLISLFSYFNNRNKEYIEKLDAWRNNFSNKINDFLEFCGENNAFAFKFDFSNSLFFNFNSKKDSEQYNAYVKAIVVKRDKLNTLYQEANAVIHVSFDEKNENQLLVEKMINELFLYMDNHLSYILDLNDIREKFYCNMIREKDVMDLLNEMFDNIKNLTLLHRSIQRLKNETVNSIDLNLINNRNILSFSTKKLLKLMVNNLNSFDEFKFYVSKDNDGLKKEFCEWLVRFEKEIEACKLEVLSGLKFAKRNFQRGI